MLSGNFRKCQQHSPPMLYPHCTQAGVVCEGWLGEGVLREYRTCYNGQALGTFSPWEATMATAQSLSAEALEPFGSYNEIHNLPPACLHLPPRSAHRNLLPSQTLADEKQIQRHQPHYLTGRKWLWEFKFVILVPPTIVDVTVAG